ncbi:MAG: helix-turn-helix transcriptional regulator [Eubacteriales bacterium]|nr:helix-turn-helix transcriptional regulator [Bacillota bacterium]MDY5345585.1 helix-turn-helix transcriptional regulator [Eubacteriales bacterium]
MCYSCDMINIKTIQNNLREAVKYSGMTQKEIANKLGINPSTVSKYLRLDKFPSLETFANLCLVLDVSADEILGITKSNRRID